MPFQLSTSVYASSAGSEIVATPDGLDLRRRRRDVGAGEIRRPNPESQRIRLRGNQLTQFEDVADREPCAPAGLTMVALERATPSALSIRNFTGVAPRLGGDRGKLTSRPNPGDHADIQPDAAIVIDLQRRGPHLVRVRRAGRTAEERLRPPRRICVQVRLLIRQLHCLPESP